MAVNTRSRFDRILIGWFIGTLVPLIIFLVTYLVKYGQLDFVVFLKDLWQMKMLLKLMSLCVYANLGIFFLFYRLKYDMASRGVIMATFMYAFLVLIAKLI